MIKRNKDLESVYLYLDIYMRKQYSLKTPNYCLGTYRLCMHGSKI